LHFGRLHLYRTPTLTYVWNFFDPCRLLLYTAPVDAFRWDRSVVAVASTAESHSDGVGCGGVINLATYDWLPTYLPVCIFSDRKGGGQQRRIIYKCVSECTYMIEKSPKHHWKKFVRTLVYMHVMPINTRHTYFCTLISHIATIVALVIVALVISFIEY